MNEDGNRVATIEAWQKFCKLCDKEPTLTQWAQYCEDNAPVRDTPTLH